MARTRRLFLANDPPHFIESGALQSLFIEWCLASEELVEQNTERIDIAACINVVTGQLGLLGAHVKRCADKLRQRRIDRALGQLLADGLRYAEVNHFYDRATVVRGDHHI